MISAPWSRGQAGQTGDNDAARYGGAVLAGSSFDEGRGHFMLDVSWDKDDGLGSITVKEAFMEAQVPVFKQLPGADTLDLNAAIRHANYSTVGGVNTWKAGLDWAPVQDVRLRGVYSVRGTATAVYHIGPLEASWRAQYLSSINDTNPTASNTVISPLYNSVPAYVYHDVQLRYTLPKVTHTEIYVGANNVFNKQPPLLPMGMASTVTGTETAADTYDVLGVFWYAGFKVKM